MKIDYTDHVNQYVQWVKEQNEFRKRCEIVEEVAKIMTDFKKTICVDFDGVIHSYNTGWKGVHVITDPPNPGAIEWLYHMAETFDMVIYSSRSKDAKGLKAMKNWINKWDMKFRERIAAAEADPPEKTLLTILTFPTQKPAAWITIDDRCICFNGSWPTVQHINEFQPWNKQGS